MTYLAFMEKIFLSFTEVVNEAGQTRGTEERANSECPHTQTLPATEIKNKNYTKQIIRHVPGLDFVQMILGLPQYNANNHPLWLFGWVFNTQNGL